ncbi:MAG: murein biosynthesis integral membrane protein MurJ [Candidatus Moranbacteria bacterium]|nr:murein biosynthesis integral membrane protein MurJ [Candidatus Moranbacteria bacterium]
MIRKIFDCFKNGETASSTISGAALLVAGLGLASRFFGLIRDRILASKFGAGDELDIYYAAFKIPDLVFNLLILGALSAAFIPVFTSLLSRDKAKKAWQLANEVLSLAVVALAVMAAVLFLLAPQLVSLITFGFSESKQEMVAVLTRIMLLSPFLLGLSGLLGGILNSFNKFLFYSLAPVFYNVGIIIGALFFTEHLGIAGLAWGVVLGALLHLSVQIPEALRCGLKFKFNFNLRDPNLRKVVTLMIPRTMSLAVVQINFLIVTVLASTLHAGSLAIFNLANNIQSVPLGMFGISFAIAAFPTLSSSWAKEKREEFIRNFSSTFKKIMFLVIPASVVFIVLRAQLVRIILGSGRFDWEDTILTFQALGIFSLSLFAQSLIPLLSRSFFAIHNTKVPFFTGLFSEAVNLGLALLLIEKYQILGLVWAFSIASIVNMLLLLLILRKKVGNLNEKEIIRKVWRVILATLVMAAGIQAGKYLIAYLLSQADIAVFGYGINMETFLGVFAQACFSLLLGGALFLAASKVLKIKELDYFIRAFRKKMFPPKNFNGYDRDQIGGIK